MLQIENEYDSYGNDRVYMEKLRQLWIDNGINISSSRERVRPLLNVLNHFEVEALDSRSADEIIKKAKSILNNY